MVTGVQGWVMSVRMAVEIKQTSQFSFVGEIFNLFVC
jgi:hypothetical protein